MTTVTYVGPGCWQYTTRSGVRYVTSEVEAVRRALAYARVRGLTVRYYASGK
jgi:hypothetical protein